MKYGMAWRDKLNEARLFYGLIYNQLAEKIGMYQAKIDEVKKELSQDEEF